MIRLIIDSGYSFSEDLVKKYDIPVLYTNLTVDNKTYDSDPFWKTIDSNYLMEYMRNGGIPKPSAAPLQKWVNSFSKLLNNEDIYVFISPHRKFGGEFRCFSIVKNLDSKFSDRFFTFEGVGSGLTVELETLEIISRMNENTTLEDIEKWVDELNRRLRCYCISRNLFHWINNGRTDEKLVERDFPEGYPVMGLSDDGSTFSLSYLGESFDKSLDFLSDKLKNTSFQKCVISYTPEIPDEYKEKFNKEICSLSCDILTEHIFSPTVTSVIGVDSISAAFI